MGEKGSGVSLNILKPQDNKSQILQWQFKYQRRKNIPLVSVYELCLFYRTSIGGCWWLLLEFIETGLTSWYSAEVLWVTNMGHRSWITTKQAHVSDALSIWGHQGRKKLKDTTMPLMSVFLNSFFQEKIDLYWPIYKPSCMILQGWSKEFCYIIPMDPIATYVKKGQNCHLTL